MQLTADDMKELEKRAGAGTRRAVRRMKNEGSRSMTTRYEREHHGLTPAEHGEIAARADAQGIREKASDPIVRKAARQAARAMAILADYNLHVNDFSAEGDGIAVEVQDEVTGDRTWICRKD